MRKLSYAIILLTAVFLTNACKKDEGNLPNISLKTGSGYVSEDATLAGGTDITIGINASKAEEKDPLVKFTITKVVDGGTPSTEYQQDLTGTDADAFSYDYTTTLENTSGQVNTYTFTVVNRDGLINEVSVTVTIQ